MRWRLRSPLLHAPPARALGESLVPLLMALLLGPRLHLAAPDRNALVSLAGLYGVIWGALRLRLPEEPWRRQVGREGLLGGVLALAVQILALVARLTVSPTSEHSPFLSDVWRLLALAGAGAALFIIARGVIHLGRHWDRLRRRHLRWALTHAHATVVGGGILLLGVLAVAVSAPYWSRSMESLIVMLVAVTALLLGGLGLALAVTIPPSALFAHLVARGTTRRIEALAAATTRLRAGDYRALVPVEGEDEVARLQEDFNALAVDLDATLRALQDERDRVAALLTARRDLIASVSHDLRTPVATLRGYLESTRRQWNGAPPPTLRQDMEVMERETIQLQALIDDLFTLVRADVERLDLHRAPTDIGLLVHRCVEGLAPLAWQSGKVEVVAHVAPDKPLALVDARRLEQVLQNLLHNAIRHTPPGGIVAVVVAAEPAAVVVQVRDTGEGIAAADLPHIWERFYRTDHARQRFGGGTGLGLALVRDLTEAMGGTVAVDSVLGEGAYFTVRLPIR